MTQLPLSMRPPNDFQFEEPEGRPFRTVSVETEVDGDGSAFAMGLYRAGVIGTDRVMQYGYYPGDPFPHVAFCKSDASVSGGELVFDRMNLQNPVHAAAFYKSMAVVRGLEKDGKIAFNPNCGGHAHIDAHGFGFYDALRVLILYGHLEEPICRLAGAGKKYGHRTLFKGHDQANTSGTGYSNPVKKAPFVDIDEAFAEVMHQATSGPWGDRAHDPYRMRGLNLTIYANCMCQGCGNSIPVKEQDDDPYSTSAYKRAEKQYVDQQTRLYISAGRSVAAANITKWRAAFKRSYQGTGQMDLKTCTCRQPKCTIEWRVWNSQSNPRIMYGWIALMQAVHAYAWKPADDLRVYRTFENLEPFDWESKPYSKLTQKAQSKAQERVAWMFAELPLTAVEKDALAYSYMRTPYKEWGKAFFAARAREPYKPPPFPNAYTPIFNRSIDDIAVVAKAQGGAAPFERTPERTDAGAFTRRLSQQLDDARRQMAAYGATTQVPYMQEDGTITMRTVDPNTIWQYAPPPPPQRLEVPPVQFVVDEDFEQDWSDPD